MSVKRCSKCGSTKIIAKTIYAASLESLEDGTFNILQQSSKFEVVPVKCPKCETLFTNGLEDLVEWNICSKCGKPSPNVTKDGVCDICKAMEARPDLAQASQEELIRMVLKLEHLNNKSETSKNTTEKPVIAQTEEVQQPVTNTAQNKIAAAQEAIKNVTEPTPENKIEQPTLPKRRGRRKVAKTEDSVENKAVETPVETSVEIPVEAPIEEELPFKPETTENNNISTEVPTVENNTSPEPVNPINTEDPFSASTMTLENALNNMGETQEAIFPIFDQSEQSF